MSKSKVDYTAYFEQVMRSMTGPGLLVGSYDAAGKANLMTIGWGSIGAIWGLPMFTVLVRPSRYTYRCIEHSGCFTVNVPSDAMGPACATCGSRSGRDIDKFAACNLTAERAQTVLAPAIVQAPIVYECQVVHSNDVLPAKLSEEVLAGAYVDGDFHRLYFGKILQVRAEPDAEKRLGA